MFRDVYHFFLLHIQYGFVAVNQYPRIIVLACLHFPSAKTTSSTTKVCIVLGDHLMYFIQHAKCGVINHNLLSAETEACSLKMKNPIFYRLKESRVIYPSFQTTQPQAKNYATCLFVSKTSASLTVLFPLIRWCNNFVDCWKRQKVSERT